MKDMLEIINARLRANSELVALAGNRIVAYAYPESADHDKLFVVISPLGPPEPAISASDTELAQGFTYQINVEDHDWKKAKQAQSLIKHEMAALNFAQVHGGLDTYFGETKRFVDARRYEGTTRLYDDDY